jgi:hypothetical protein
MDYAENRARLHEFYGHVALRVGGGSTHYLSVELAEKLSAELLLASQQIKHGNHYPTTTVFTSDLNESESNG